MLSFIKFILTSMFIRFCSCSSNEYNNMISFCTLFSADKLRFFLVNQKIALYNKLEEYIKPITDEINTQGCFKFIKIEDKEGKSVSDKKIDDLDYHDNEYVKELCKYIIDPNQKVVDYLDFCDNLKKCKYMNFDDFINDERKYDRSYNITIDECKFDFFIKIKEYFDSLYLSEFYNCKFRNTFDSLKKIQDLKSYLFSNFSPFNDKISTSIKKIKSYSNKELKNEFFFRNKLSNEMAFDKNLINNLSIKTKNLSEEVKSLTKNCIQLLSELFLTKCDILASDFILKISLLAKNNEVLEHLNNAIQLENVFITRRNESNRPNEFFELENFYLSLFYVQLEQQIKCFKTKEEEYQRKVPRFIIDSEVDYKSFNDKFGKLQIECDFKKNFYSTEKKFYEDIYMQFLHNESLKSQFIEFIKERLKNIDDEKEEAILKLKKELAKIQETKNIFTTNDFNKLIKTPKKFLILKNEYSFLCEILSLKYNGTIIELKSKIDALNFLISLTFKSYKENLFSQEIKKHEKNIKELEKLVEKYFKKDLEITHPVSFSYTSPEGSLKTRTTKYYY